MMLEQAVLRAMEEQDLSDVMKIESAVFPFPWSKYSFITELHNPNAYYLVAIYHGTVVAYGGVWIISTEAHITTIAVDPSFQRNGFGSMLLRALIAHAWEQGGIMVSLEVRRSNKKAVTFYLHHGFTNVGTIPSYYLEDGEDALKMTYYKLAHQQVSFLLIHCSLSITEVSIIQNDPKLGLKQIIKAAVNSGSAFSEESGTESLKFVVSATLVRLSELDAIAVYVDRHQEEECCEAIQFTKGLAYGLNKPCIVLAGTIGNVAQAAFEKLLSGDYTI
ncbi:MAG: ribosomal protein S18-alanine N-acetyltransferase [Thermoanaerobacteraceae bacterium]|nr:ribosomal protein S18-alanine N-acetyltransferase [Thermoanaerobacteraceae bacterium]